MRSSLVERAAEHARARLDLLRRARVAAMMLVIDRAEQPQSVAVLNADADTHGEAAAAASSSPTFVKVEQAAAPQVNVQVDSPAAPQVTANNYVSVKPTPVEVNVAAPEVNVAAPVINVLPARHPGIVIPPAAVHVPAPVVNVSPADVRIDAKVDVPATVVNLPAMQVTNTLPEMSPRIEVQVPEIKLGVGDEVLALLERIATAVETPAAKKRELVIERDEDGNMVSVKER